MQQPLDQTTPPQMRSPARHARWWSSSRAHAVFLAASALGLELLPVEAVFIIVAAGDGLDVSGVALPIWYGALLLVAARLVGGRLRRVRTFGALLATAPLALIAWLVLLRVSPAAYGQTSRGPLDLDWLGALATDVVKGTDTVVRAFGLFLLVIYLTARGIRVGTRPPLLDDTLRRFKVGMVILVGAIAVLAVTQTPVRAQALGAFILLLPAEVFCGLAASALTRLTVRALSAAEAERQEPWVSGAIGLAGSVVAFALLLALIISGGEVSALLTHLGPVGVALDNLGRWITDAIGQLLGLIFGLPVRALKSAVAHTTTSPISIPSRCTTAACEHQANSPPPLFLLILAVLFYSFLLLVLIVVLVRLYRILREWLAKRVRTAPASAVEERESLDGRSLLRKQLRDLFRRRRPQHPSYAEESLDPRSIRALYRDVLRTATRVGVPRLSAETPDEFAARAAATPPLTANPAETSADLAGLSEAYDAVRYGDARESTEDQRTAAERARRLVARLRPRGRRPAS